jgi:ABC-type arginine/histidine transport system permease subunit
LIASQRAAAEGFAGTLNEQLTPSALRTVLPLAANAALVAVMQNTSSVAATISIVNLMARILPKFW